ncbi:MAG: asparagine synthase-related protein [Methanosarcina sp.]|jgi:tRNA(Ile)-lysidine synthase TilS/MesJ
MSKLVCKKCVLDSDIPGITINKETGLCHFCETYKPLSSQEKSDYLTKIEGLFEEYGGRGKYDVIYALSGGKDSSYTLYKLKKDYPSLKVLAVQFQNGFTSEGAVKNAKKMCKITGSDYYQLTMGKEILYDTFRKAAESYDAFPKFAKYRASDICNVCITIIKQKLIEQAIIQKAPFIVFAFTAGQSPNPIINLSPSFIKWSRSLFETQLQKIGIDDKDELFLLKKEVIENMGESTLSILHPLCLWEYSEEKVLETLLEIGWEQPGINDSNSTNCTLNSFACYNHLEKYGFHPYAFDTAGLVRSGEMSREEGFGKINQELSEQLIEEAAKKLKVKVKSPQKILTTI